VPDPNAKTVLLIDDNAVQLAARKGVLESAGFRVLISTDPLHALETLRSPGDGVRIDGVITDHIMPHVSGAVFVRKLRETDAQVPVMVVSGLADAENEYEGLKVIFRHKPLLPAEMISAVREMVGGGE
jgi:DNA-binding response OmpR family regulator